jgi:hypothetical protein
MDYRNYRGDGIKIPPKIRRYLHKLRPVGVVLMLCGIAIPMLILLKILESTLFINILAYTLILGGPILYLVGMIFDTVVDRSQ